MSDSHEAAPEGAPGEPKRTVAEIIAHADELADRFEAFGAEPSDVAGLIRHVRELQEQDERNLAEMVRMQAEIDNARRRRDEAYAESDEIATELHNERARANRIDAGIRGLHKPVRVGSVEVCLTCTDAAGAASFPCPTIAVLDGEATT